MSGADQTRQTASSTLPVPPYFPVRWEQPDDARRFWTLDRMHWPAPVTPLDFALYHATVFEHGFNRAAQAYELPTRVQVRRINTYRYSATMTLAESPNAAKERDQRIRGRMDAAMVDLADAWHREFLPEIKRHLNYWENYNLLGSSMPALLAHLDETVARTKRLVEIHFLIWFPLMLALSTFDDLYRRLFRSETSLEAYRLLDGFDNKTLETDRALWYLSRLARSCPEVRGAIEERDADDVVVALGQSSEGQTFLRELRAFLFEYGQRSNGWDVSSPTWIEDPSPAIRNLQRYLGQPDREPLADLATLAAERERLIAEARARLSRQPQSVIDRFEILLKMAQEAIVLTEDHAFWIDFRGRYRVRLVLLEFGRRFAEAGLFDERDDVFYLTLDELRETADGLPHINRRRVVGGRRAEMEYFRTVSPPPALGTAPSGPPPDSPLRQIQGKFWEVPLPIQTEQNVLRGNPGSPGIARGPARLVRSPAEAMTLRPGDILVAETTAPAWTPLFATAAAVVTDAGGALSHCAVVAREYRIPAVVGTGQATALIRDGQIIEVDGGAGLVRIVSPA